MEVRLEQPRKAYSPMLVTLSGITIDFRPKQPEKADVPIPVIASGMMVFLHPHFKMFVDDSIIALQPNLESNIGLSFETTIEVRLEQPRKAYPPMLVTPSGMTIEVKLEQPENAYSPMIVTPSGIAIEVRPEQPEKARVPIFVTLLGIYVFLQPAINVFEDVSIIALQFSL